MITEFLYTGYLMDYINPKDLIFWADQQIVKGEATPELMNLSLASNKSEIINALGKLRKGENNQNIDIYYFSLYNFLLSKQLAQWQIIGKEICKLYTYNFIDIPDNEFFFSRLLDYYELLRDGLPGNMQMPAELNNFLSNYNKDIQIFKFLKFNIKGIEIFNL